MKSTRSRAVAQSLFPMLLLIPNSLAYGHAEFEPINDGLILVADDDKRKDTGYPSVIRIPDWVPAAERADSSANYYLYYGEHSGMRISMKWAANIEGPWTDYHVSADRKGVLNARLDSLRSTFSHLAHADAYVDEENQRFMLFFHARNQPDEQGDTGIVRSSHANFVATSPYGLNFNDPNTGGGLPGYGPETIMDDGLIRDIIIASNYARVFRVRDDWYSVGKRGVLEKAPDRANPLAPRSDPGERAWTLDTTPTSLWANDTFPYFSHPYHSPACAFTGSTEFANHANNPNPGSRITCGSGGADARVNHVGVNMITEYDQLEVFFYVKESSANFDNGNLDYPSLYRIVYDTSDTDFQNWDVVRDQNGQVLFDEYLGPADINKAIVSVANNKADVDSMGASDIFIDDDGAHYLFFAYVSSRFNCTDGAINCSQGEGEIASLKIHPNCSNGIDDDNDGYTDFLEDADCSSAVDRSEFSVVPALPPGC